MPARKRTFDEVQQDDITPQPPSLLHRIRNCWQFAALVQWIFFFGPVVKIDKDIDVDILEEECLKPGTSHLLADIGLALLKYVSSHRGLTPDIFDEYTRRQYLAKAPSLNPFGDEEEPKHFDDFDIFTKLRVLHQLSVWTLNNPERIREKMEEKDNEQTQWRIEPLGWDRDDRSYFVLDDDRLYRRTEPPPPPPEPKAKPKPKRSVKRIRRSTRNQRSDSPADSGEEDEDLVRAIEASREEAVKEDSMVEEDDGLGGAKWECMAVTLAEYNEFLDTIKKTKDPNEKALHARIIREVLPVIEKRVEAQERKAAQRRRELETLEKLATAKRSSRLADKMEKQKAEAAAEETERKRRDELAMAQREQEKINKLEEARESRMITREQRLREREAKRILHEEQLRRLRDEETPETSTGARTSERNRKNELEKTQQALEQLEEDEEEWYFDCAICGVHGKNLDDGSHSMACEKCSVWQHSACHGISEAEADSDEFHFICASCRKPKVTSLKLRLGPSISPKENKIPINGNSPMSSGTLNGNQQPTSTEVKALVPTSPRSTASQIKQLKPTIEPQLNGDPSTAISKQQSDRYLTKSQGIFPPQARPNGYSALGVESFSAKPVPQLNGNSQSAPTQSQQQQTLHNPYLNHFNRLSSSPFPNNKSSITTPAPSRANLPFTSASPQPAINTTTNTAAHTSPPSNLGSSPIPSLNATEGNTGVRFSASPKPFGSPRSNSYIPVAVLPPNTIGTSQQQQQPAPPRYTRAASPTKSSPPPMTPMPQISHGSTVIPGSAGSASFFTAPGSAASQPNSGVSPTKYDVHIPAPLTLTSYDGTLDVISSPVLSPSVNAGQLNLAPPVKKQLTPIKTQQRLSVSRSPSPRLSPTTNANARSPESPVKKATPASLPGPSPVKLYGSRASDPKTELAQNGALSDSEQLDADVAMDDAPLQTDAGVAAEATPEDAHLLTA